MFKKNKALAEQRGDGGGGVVGCGGQEPVATGPDPAAAAEGMGLEVENHEVWNNPRRKYYQGPHCKQRRNCLQGDTNSQKDGCAVGGCVQ